MRTEDGYIIHKCLNGDSAAFGFLVDKYKASVYAFAHSRLRHFHDAEDITQEVFIKAYRKLHTLKRWDNFLAWLYAITSNLCKNFLRSKFNRPDREFIADQDLVSFGYSSMNSYHEEQVHDSLHEALDSLPEMYRQVLTLYYLGGMTSKEIAQFLGTSPSTIRQRLSRARLKLKKEMLDMMSTTYDQQKLQPSFTFRIVEMVKQIKIQPAPRSTPLLPLGLSAATGIVLTILSFTPYFISLTPLGALLGSPLPSETKVMAEGELPVDVLEISEIMFLSGEQGDDDGGVAKLPNPQNAFAPPLAPSSGKGTWTRKADIPTARVALRTSVVDGKIYAVGGLLENLETLSTVEEYDPMTDTWTKKTNMSTKRWKSSTNTVNRTIYAIGGFDGAPAAEILSSVEEYDPVADTWTKKTDMPTPRGAHSASVVNGKIYVIGGWNGKRLSTVEEYNPATDTWTEKTDMPTARGDLFTGVVNGKIYAIGGGDVLSIVEEYDPATDKWTRKADMPTSRCLSSISVVNGKIYVFGGYDGINDLSIVEEYNPATDTWTKKNDMPTPRHSLSTSAVNGRIYIIGGGPIQIVKGIIEEFDTGFRAIEAEGKLPTTWGRMKTEK